MARRVTCICNDENNYNQQIHSTDNKRIKQEYWNNLKKKFKSNNILNRGKEGQGGEYSDPNILAFHK